MKFLNPHCPSCGSTAGIDISARREDVVAIHCNSCRLTTLIQAHDDETCPECKADRFNHIDGCVSDRSYAV